MLSIASLSIRASAYQKPTSEAIGSSSAVTAREADQRSAYDDRSGKQCGRGRTEHQEHMPVPVVGTEC
jgi:hypothetical protein